MPRLTRYGVLSGTLPIVYCHNCIMCFVEKVPEGIEYLYVVEKEESKCSSCGSLSFPVFNPMLSNPSVIN